MTGAVFSATTRVVRTVRTVRRADSRAATEPRPGRNATEPAAIAETTPYRRASERDLLVAESAAPARDSLPYCELEIATAELARELCAAEPETGAMAWIGVTLADPQIGASIVVGSWLRPEFRVTSPVTHVFPCEDGVLVQTTTRSRYFVEPSGDVYLVRSGR